MKPWFGYPAVKPPCAGDYLCWVETPTMGGEARRDMRIFFWSEYDGGWNVMGSIVRYWQILPEPPGGDAE